MVVVVLLMKVVVEPLNNWLLSWNAPKCCNQCTAFSSSGWSKTTSECSVWIEPLSYMWLSCSPQCIYEETMYMNRHGSWWWWNKRKAGAEFQTERRKFSLKLSLSLNSWCPPVRPSVAVQAGLYLSMYIGPQFDQEKVGNFNYARKKGSLNSWINYQLLVDPRVSSLQLKPFGGSQTSKA